MATIYDEAGTVVATGVGVADASQLGSRRIDVVHDLALGGLPYVVRKAAAGYAGSLELLCSDVDTAWAIHQAHAAGLVRLDTYTAQNWLTNPSFETNGAWGQTGSIASITQGGFSVVDGQFAVLVTANSAPDSATSGVWLDLSGAVTPGQWVAARMPVRPGGVIPTPRVRISIQFRDSGGVLLVNSISPTFDPGSFVYTELTYSAQAPAGAVSARLALYLSNQTTDFPDPDTSVSTDAWIAAVADTQADALSAVAVYFDGDTPPPGYAARWDGPANASTSSLSALPAFDMTYSVVSGVDVPHQLDAGIWAVRVPQVQEVAP